MHRQHYIAQLVDFVTGVRDDVAQRRVRRRRRRPSFGHVDAADVGDAASDVRRRRRRRRFWGRPHHHKYVGQSNITKVFNSNLRIYVIQNLNEDELMHARPG